MRISELIGDFADMFGQSKAPEQPVIGGIHIEILNRPDVHEVEANTEDNTDTTTMVAPLQQKLELLKRAVGVENMYDDMSYDDDLNHILKIAGVPTATIFDAGDDEPLDS
jgi:hypothetical protein